MADSDVINHNFYEQNGKTGLTSLRFSSAIIYSSILFHCFILSLEQNISTIEKVTSLNCNNILSLFIEVTYVTSSLVLSAVRTTWRY